MHPSKTVLHAPSASPKGKIFVILKAKTESGFHVTTENGAVGKTLKPIPRTTEPVSEAAADKLIDQLIKRKTTAKSNYTKVDDVDEHLEQTTAGPSINSESAFSSPLLSITDPEEYLQDDDWGSQLKIDGERRLVESSNSVAAYGRYGQSKTIPVAIAESFNGLEITVDAEIDESGLHLFDLLSAGGVEITDLPYATRYRSLADIYRESLISNQKIHLLPLLTGEKAKREALLLASSTGQEGFVFKRLNSKYIRAITASNKHPALKYKFTDTASVFVTSKTRNKRSVGISVMNGNDIVGVGKVTIPTSADIPVEGAIIEVRYRHYNSGGALIEACFLRTRDDVFLEHCTVQKLKQIT